MTFTHLDDVLAEVAPLGRCFTDGGYRLYLVGGIVRDQWLDRPLDGSSDIDLTTNALPGDIKRLVAPLADDLWTQGEKFGTIGLRAAGRDYEITTHRAESYRDESRKPTVSFGDDIEVDLSRRDFTVNAMAIELPAGGLVDPYRGAEDLQAGRLRTPLSPDISFTDDPLRMLRAARFATTFSLEVDPELEASASKLHQRLRIVAIERIGVEMRRLLALPSARIGLTFLADTGLLAEVLSYGDPSLIDRIQGRLPAAIEISDRLSATWQVRLAGIGVAVFDTLEGVQAMCRRLRLSRQDERLVSRVTRSALAVVQAGDTEPETLRRWIADCDDPAAAIELARAIAATSEHVNGFAHAVDRLRGVENITDIELLDGAEIMAVLGIGPGPDIGQAHRYLRECYFARGHLSEPQQIELLTTWWSERQAT